MSTREIKENVSDVVLVAIGITAVVLLSIVFITLALQGIPEVVSNGI